MLRSSGTNISTDDSAQQRGIFASSVSSTVQQTRPMRQTLKCERTFQPQHCDLRELIYPRLKGAAHLLISAVRHLCCAVMTTVCFGKCDGLLIEAESWEQPHVRQLTIQALKSSSWKVSHHFLWFLAWLHDTLPVSAV